MKITFESRKFSASQFNLVALPCFELTKKGKLDDHLPLTSLSSSVQKALIKRVADTDFSGKVGQRCTFDVNNGAFRVVLIGLGKAPGDAVTPALRSVGAALWRDACAIGAKSVAVVFSSGGAPIGAEESTALIEAFLSGGYRYTKFQTTAKKPPEPTHLTLFGFAPLTSKELRSVQSLHKAVCSARDLINLPPNECNPSYLAQYCTELSKRTALSCQILDRAKLEKLGAGALLAVAKGSDQPPYLIKLATAKPQGDAPVIALVGKGVTFDSGGLSIKTAASMMEMKADIYVADAVIAAMEALNDKTLPVEVRAYIPTVENMINGQATRPGDVAKTLSGNTVEILNTDAEGRLILCDAIALAEQEGADIIIDIATLTGACIVALGTKYAGLFSDDERLCQTILGAAQQSGERFWRLPLAAEYDDLIKSSIADMKNIGNQWGGAITAAIFLKRFIKKARWAHLDIAGPAFDESGGGDVPKGGAGFGVRTLVRTVEGIAGERFES